MKIINLIILFVAITSTSYPQALDNEFQAYFAKVTSTIQKNTEDLTAKDIEILKEAEKISINHFGETYQQSMKNLIQKSSKKLNEYDYYITRKKQIEQEMLRKEQQIEFTESQLRQTEQERDSAIYFSELLKKEIADLNKRIKELTTDKKNFEKANKMLIEDNQNYQAVISNTRASLSRIQKLLSTTPIKSEISDQVPASLIDSLELVECGIAETLMNNFNLTLRAMLNDPKFIDTVAKYFKQNKSLPADIDEYVQSGRDLAEKMTISSMDCVRISGASILNAIENFTLEIENQSGKWKFDDVILIPGLILLIILIIVILLIIRKKRT